MCIRDRFYIVQPMMFMMVGMFMAMRMPMIVFMFMSVIMVVLVAMLVRMFMDMFRIQAFFFLTIYRYSHMCAGNTAFHSLFRPKAYARQIKSVQALNKPHGIRMKFQQGGCKHIPCGSHIAFQIECLHYFPSI